MTPSEVMRFELRRREALMTQWKRQRVRAVAAVGEALAAVDEAEDRLRDIGAEIEALRAGIDRLAEQDADLASAVMEGTKLDGGS